MKTYQQMAVEVLKARDAHLLKLQRRKTLFRICMPIAASFSFSVLIGLHLWQQNLPEIQHIPENTVESSQSTNSENTELPAYPRTDSPLLLPSESTEIQETTALLLESAFPGTVHSTVITESEPIPELSETLPFPEAEMPSEESIVIPETVLIPPEQTVTEILETLPSETSPPIEDFPMASIPATEEFPVPDGDQPTEPETNPVLVTPPLQEITLHLASNNDVDTLEEVVFQSTGYTLQAEAVGHWFDTVDVIISYPDGSHKFIEHLGDAYCVLDFPADLLAAVQFSGDDRYYLFCSEALSEEEFREILADSGILQ